MCKLFLIALFSSFFQQDPNTISPDGKFMVTMEMKEESDLQMRYIIKLTDNISKATTEIANCIRRDLPAPNFYWDKNSTYLVFEQCTELFKNSRIKVLNLKTRKIDFELIGLIGNKDNNQQQFDSNNEILIYFDTSIADNNQIPDLYTFDLKTKKKKKILVFGIAMDMEFPEIQKVDGSKQIKVSYNDTIAGERITKEINY